MNGFPALLTRPADALPAVPPSTAELTTVRFALDNGVPAKIPLAGERALVLSVGAGRARFYLDADPAAVVLAIGAAAPPADPTLARDPDLPVARLSLLDSATLGDSVPVVGGVAMTVAVAGLAAFEVTVDALTVTAGSLRSPGQYGSSIALRWRDLHPSSNAGPPLATGDDAIPRPRLAAYLRFARRGVA
jgi:hypothetical protein